MIEIRRCDSEEYLDGWHRERSESNREENCSKQSQDGMCVVQICKIEMQNTVVYLGLGLSYVFSLTLNGVVCRLEPWFVTVAYALVFFRVCY